jgi:peptidoglycan hydrolase-like protein with peptidoglycan-binding domain
LRFEKVRKPSRARAVAIETDDDERPTAGLLRRLATHDPKDLMCAVVAAAAATAILVNALFMQSGPHPAPIFANKRPASAAELAGAAALPRSRPADQEVIRADTHARARAELIADIQRELIKRGFYEGSADGVYGFRTDAAVRDFEQAAGLRPSAEPTEALLRTIAQSSVRAPAAVASRGDPIADLLAPNRRVVAVQRVLAEFGYGQIKPSGVLDPETKAAIERFERERKLPVSGRVTDRLARELAVLSGRPLD